MNSFQFSSLSNNPFISSTFWDRQNELRTIYRYLLSQPPQCCAIIGETSFGKTTLLRYLSDPQNMSEVDEALKQHFTFVYFDCISFLEIARREGYASARFWWDLYKAFSRKVGEEKRLSAELEPRINTDQNYIDIALEIKWELEDLIRDQQRIVIFVLDNFEGVARLPVRDSEWLRSMTLLPCAFVVASRHLLYLLYHPSSLENPSPLWNLFADPIYLGLLPEHDVKNILHQASEEVGALGSSWSQGDINFIRETAGRHPEFIRIVCSHLFEQRLRDGQAARTEKSEVDAEFLKYSIQEVTRPICKQLWHGLADSELWGVPRVANPPKEEGAQPLSPYQEGLIEIAKGNIPGDKKMLFVLEQRGLIERVDRTWRVFSEIMRLFILEQAQQTGMSKLTPFREQTSSDGATALSDGSASEPPGQEPFPLIRASDGKKTSRSASIGRREMPNFTYLEREVYDYLKSHAGEVCSRDEIKRAVWKGKDAEPKNSALQKIIERVRDKIEPDPENPRYLLAVRGQGYILREDPLDSRAY